MKIEKVIDVKHSIIVLRIIGAKIILVDSSNAVRIFDLKTLKVVDGFKAIFEINPQLLHGVDVTNDGTFVAFSTRKDGVRLYSTKTKKLKTRFKRHIGEVETICINRDRTYLATGGQDGKTFLWSLRTGKLVGSFPHHTDFVTSIAFSRNGQWIATGSYDRRIKVTNILSLGQTIELKAHASAVVYLFFIDNTRLLSADKDGNLVIWDIFAKKAISRPPKMMDKVTSMCVSPDKKYLLISDIGGFVSLYDFNTFELIEKRYLYYKVAVRKINFESEHKRLIVGLDDGKVLFYSPYKDVEKLKILRDEKNYDEFHKLVESNKILVNTKVYIDYQNSWNDAYENAIKLAENGKIDVAKSILEPYRNDPIRRMTVQQLFNDFKQFEKFKDAATGRRYQIAYAIAEQYERLKESKYYAQMEEEWEKSFQLVKKLILKDGDPEKIDSLLRPFKTILSKQKIINEFFQEKGNLYKVFVKLCKNKNYKEALALGRKYQVLQELNEYKRLEEMSKKMIDDAKDSFKSGDFKSAVKNAREAQYFPDNYEEAKLIIERANMYMKALSYYADKNYDMVYEIVEKFPYLLETDILQKLEADWDKVVKKAEIFAGKADINSVKKCIAPFLKYKQKRAKIVTLLKMTYISQIEKLIREKSQKVQEAMKRYEEIFGDDHEIFALKNMVGLDTGEQKEAIAYEKINLKSLPDRLV